MKKQLLSIACIACALMMISCNGGKKAADKDAEEALEEVAEFTGSMFSKDAAKYYIKDFKLKFSDLEPDYTYTSDDKNFAGDTRKVVAIFPVEEGQEFTEEQFEAAVTKVYNATKKASDNGICVYGFEKKDTKEEAMAERTLEEVLAGTTIMGIKIDDASWAYLLNGKFYAVNVDKTSAKNGYKVVIGEGLQKSFEETWKEAEKQLEEIENDPEKKKAVDEAVDKALKDAGLK